MTDFKYELDLIKKSLSTQDLFIIYEDDSLSKQDSIFFKSLLEKELKLYTIKVENFKTFHIQKTNS